MSILVTGGAGYVGSHAVLQLLKQGEDVIVLDSLVKGHKEAVLTNKWVEGDIRDAKLLDSLFQNHDIEAVMHFSAASLVGESVSDPLKYYEINVSGTQTLLSKMQQYGVKKFVFSSTAATYGEPDRIPIEETNATVPTNPYGETKLAVEKMLKWCDQAYGMKYVALRYFNAAGADPDGRIGEDHDPETHLIPLILQVALGQREFISIFGSDYPTEDGTCIRDYIHVIDLADAHLLALKRLRERNESGIFNLGNGTGFSVYQVIEKAREITGHPIPARQAARRAGDPAVLIASSAKAQSELGWQPKYNQLDEIIRTAWNWHKEHPNGY